MHTQNLLYNFYNDIQLSIIIDINDDNVEKLQPLIDSIQNNIKIPHEVVFIDQRLDTRNAPEKNVNTWIDGAKVFDTHYKKIGHWPAMVDGALVAEGNYLWFLDETNTVNEVSAATIGEAFEDDYDVINFARDDAELLLAYSTVFEKNNCFSTYCKSLVDLVNREVSKDIFSPYNVNPDTIKDVGWEPWNRWISRALFYKVMNRYLLFNLKDQPVFVGDQFLCYILYEQEELKEYLICHNFTNGIIPQEEIDGKSYNKDGQLNYPEFYNNIEKEKF